MALPSPTLRFSSARRSPLSADLVGPPGDWGRGARVSAPHAPSAGSVASVLHTEAFSGPTGVEDLDLRGFSGSGVCTAMIKNIHHKSTNDSIALALDACGLKGRYTTIYAPGNPARKTNLGYAFVNFVCVEDLQELHRRCHGRPFDGAPPTKCCSVSVSARQGIKGPRTAAGKKKASGEEPRPLGPSLRESLAQWGPPGPAPAPQGADLPPGLGHVATASLEASIRALIDERCAGR